METALPAMGFAASCVWAAVIGLWFNINTAWLVRSIQDAMSKDGKRWPFWGNRARMWAFVLRPETLLDKSDSPPVAAAKCALVTHRRNLGRTIGLLVGGMVALSAAGVAGMIAIGLIN
jgi:hypothetical protein